mgnify:FL=1
MKTSQVFLRASIVALLLFGTTTSAIAHHGEDDDTPEVSSSVTASPSSTPEHRSEQEHELEHQSEALRESAQKLKAAIDQKREARKDDNRIKRCEQKESDGQQRFENIHARSGEIKSRIEGILTRVEAYVNANGIVVPNSEALLADIQAKQQAAESALAEIKVTAQGFSCQNDDAKEQASLIKAQVEAYKATVKAYRESVRNYLDAVLTAVQPSASASVTPTPAPSGGV